MARDYSNYSIAELRESLSVVDGRRYPENKAAIEAEIQSRKDSGAYAEEEQALKAEAMAKAEAKFDFAQKAQPAIAWYLIISGGFILASTLFPLPYVGSLMQVAILGIGVLYVLATVFGGVALLKNKSWGPILVIGLLCVQLVQVSSSIFSFKALSAFAFYLNVSADWDVGVSAEIRPGFWLVLGGVQPASLGVNIYVAWLISLVATANGWFRSDTELA
jgi:hypothetical protein